MPVQGVRQEGALLKAPQTVHQNVRRLLAVILRMLPLSLDIHEASVNHFIATATTTGALVNFHGYPGTQRVILFPQVWNAD